MAPHSSTLAWKIPWMEEPCRLQSVGSLRVRHDEATSLSIFTFHFHALEKEMATHSSVLAWTIPEYSRCSNYILPTVYFINGEGNATPLQYSCLENPMDGGAWWAAVHGVTKSWT